MELSEGLPRDAKQTTILSVNGKIFVGGLQDSQSAV
jgi:hypothetical protein